MRATPRGFTQLVFLKVWLPCCVNRFIWIKFVSNLFEVNQICIWISGSRRTAPWKEAGGLGKPDMVSLLSGVLPVEDAGPFLSSLYLLELEGPEMLSDSQHAQDPSLVFWAFQLGLLSWIGARVQRGRQWTTGRLFCPKHLYCSLPKPKSLGLLLPPQPITHLRVPPAALGLGSQSLNSDLWWEINPPAHNHWKNCGKACAAMAVKLCSHFWGSQSMGSRQAQNQNRGSPESEHWGLLGEAGKTSKTWTESWNGSPAWRPALRESE